MDVRKVLKEIRTNRIREAELWEKLDPDLVVEAITKTMKMSGSCDIEVLLQYLYYLPEDLRYQLYLFGKLFELYRSGYFREPDLNMLLKEIKKTFVDKRSSPPNSPNYPDFPPKPKFPACILLLLLM